MLKITRIHVKNFLSFRECTFELEDLQLLIGPNNSGKTNLLRVFEFLGNMANLNASQIDLTKFRFQHKEYHEKKTAGDQLPDPIQISVEFIDTNLENRFFYYRIELYRNQERKTRHNELLGYTSTKFDTNQFKRLNGSDLGTLGKFKQMILLRNATISLAQDPSRGGIGGYNIANPSSETYFLRFNENKIILGSQYSAYELGNFLRFGLNETDLFGIGNELQEFFRSLIIYKPEPYYIKLPVDRFQIEETIKGNCENIVPYLENLIISDTERFNWVNTELAKCIPDFKGYNFDTLSENGTSSIGGQTTKNVRYLRLKDRFDVNHYAKDASDGTLYFLMLLTVIHQKNMPSILMLEEPETGIHPNRISEIMEYLLQLREQYPDLSIIVTTHHPYLVDQFSNMPDRIWVFESKDGETIVKNLERDIIEPLDEKRKAAGKEPIDYTSSLGEHWALGYLGGVPKAIKHR